MKNALIHTRTEAESNVMREDAKHTGTFVVGLNDNTKMKLIKAAATGRPIITNGLPMDLAAELGPVIIQRCWNVSKDDGTSSRGVRAPERMVVLRIKDEDAYKALTKEAVFTSAIEVDDDSEEDESL